MAAALPGFSLVTAVILASVAAVSGQATPLPNYVETFCSCYSDFSPFCPVPDDLGRTSLYSGRAGFLRGAQDFSGVQSFSFWLRMVPLCDGVDVSYYVMDGREGGADTFFWSGSPTLGPGWAALYVDGDAVPDLSNFDLPGVLAVGVWKHVYVEAASAFTSDMTFLGRFTDNEMSIATMDDLRIYNRPLTAAEVQAESVYGAAPHSGLVAQFPFNECAGTIATSTDGNHALNLAGTGNIHVCPSTTPTHYIANNAAGFIYGAQPFPNVRSVSFWVKLDRCNDLGAGLYLLDAREAAADSYFYNFGSGALWTAAYVNAQPMPIPFTTDQYYDHLHHGQWVHVHLEAAQAFTSEIHFLSRFSLVEITPGAIADVRLYNTVLGVPDIETEALGAAPKAGIIAQFLLDECAGDTAASTDNAYTLTLANGAAFVC
mmetsp:Transcript_29782/g.97046  ORF Transcript_29782/g.97046 Transcript_29782/m.97046 type:complete len:430 (+) Transcript_29782:160-1449(+)